MRTCKVEQETRVDCSSAKDSQTLLTVLFDHVGKAYVENVLD
jgi:hypothetical protein